METKNTPIKVGQCWIPKDPSKESPTYHRAVIVGLGKYGVTYRSAKTPKFQGVSATEGFLERYKREDKQC